MMFASSPSASILRKSIRFQLYRCRQSSRVTSRTVSLVPPDCGSRTSAFSSELSLTVSCAVPQSQVGHYARDDLSEVIGRNTLREELGSAEAGSKAQTVPVGPMTSAMDSV